MKHFITNLEKDTKNNTFFRNVLFTTNNLQLVVMSLREGEEIGSEVHELDQFIRVEEGEAKAVLDGEEFTLVDGDVVIIPKGVNHNITNIGNVDLKLYSIYTPPEHKHGTIHKTKEEAIEEHFDGVTSLS
jgi:mannose-6-phosphate isomerase-like protein (cupin superfamily)